MGLRERTEHLIDLARVRSRKPVFVLADAGLLIASVIAAVWLRFDGRVPADVWSRMPLIVVLSLAIRLAVFWTQRLYAFSWPYVGLEDMVAVFRGVTLGTLLFWTAVAAVIRAGYMPGFPRAALLIEYVITLYAIGAFRMGGRIYQYLVHRSPAVGRPAVIVGAGAAGNQLARSLRETPNSGYAVIGFIDDDVRKVGTVIHGLQVLGNREDLPAIIRGRRVEAVLIAMPTAPSRVIRNVVSLARAAGVREIRIIPGLDRILNGQLSFTDLREVQLTDLLGREVVQIDTAEVRSWLRNRVVVVTGAGGSIGSELCRQLAQFGPRSIVLLDRDETGLFTVVQELRRAEQRVRTSLTDVCDAGKVREVFLQIRPQVVFHAAAYKHVGLMERHPEEAVVTNILGTLSVAQASIESGVERFVLISTDKAVNPTSVMGATKRAAEQLCLVLNGRGSTRFLAVRFGNVLGSRGSVVPLFQDNIRRGEPLTIRGPEMRRYFMAVSEAVLLVLQAGAMGEGGEIFALDMGEPVRIVDLAREMICLSGLEPDKDVPIIFADPEPGEKAQEDLLTAEEGTMATRHDRIFVAPGSAPASTETFLSQMVSLQEMVRVHDLDGVVRLLRALVPTYRPSEYLLSRVTSRRSG